MSETLTNFSVQVMIVDHCNLNCRGCSVFSPIASPRFMDSQAFMSDIEQLTKLFFRPPPFFSNRAFKMHYLRLMGGEPLLHPEIIELMHIAREYLPLDVVLSITTNGLLLPKMKDEFWNALIQYDAYIHYSIYPVTPPLPDQIASDDNLSQRVLPYTPIGAINRWCKWVIDDQGSQNRDFSCKRCVASKGGCNNLYQGRIARCAQVFAMERYAKYFSVSGLPNPDSSSLDIYSAQSSDQILDFLGKVPLACAYCDKRENYDTDWGRSKKLKSEWGLE